MNLGMLLDMAASGLAGRTALGRHADGLTFEELGLRARRVAAFLDDLPGDRVGLVDVNTDAVPLTFLGAALTGKPFAPVNYRLPDAQLVAIARRLAPATLVVGPGVADRLGQIEGIHLIDRAELLSAAADPDRLAPAGPEVDPGGIAVLLFTSGTTGEPKAAVLRHRNLTAYILSTVEFAAAGSEECTLIGVPPYHVAGVAAVLSNLYIGRRTVRLESFEPAEWVRLARDEQVTHAMVVPTMLTRILDVLEQDGGDGVPVLRVLSYGGGPMPLPVIERALTVLPKVDFVNAYGLTETASTISVLGPDDHREAIAATDAGVRARLGSVGRPLPSVEIEIRSADGVRCAAGERGEIWVRGEQVSGEYLDRRVTDDAGWFRTRDEGLLDDGGYLFVFGRMDDVIVRGGENLSPGEIEACLLEHPAVAEAAVFGVPNDEWGEAVVAAVVLVPNAIAGVDELREHVRSRMRSTCGPSRLEVRESLPYNDTGKLLRRELRAVSGRDNPQANGLPR